MYVDSPLIHLAAPPFPYFIECGRTVYAPGEQHPNRAGIGLFDLLLVERGALYMGEEKKRWAVPAGHMLLLLPDRYHYAAEPCREETSFTWIHFRTIGDWRQTEDDVVPLNRVDHTDRFGVSPYFIRLPQFGPGPGPDTPGRTGLAELLLQLAGQRRSSAVWEQQRIFEELLRSLDLSRHDSGRTHALELAERTEAYLRSHYTEPLTNASLSEALHFHYNYLSRCMKRVYGVTPMEYLTDYRLEQAKLLLLKTELPVALIAERTGFGSTPYFSRRFAERMGNSPLRFRRRHSR
ncbi:helix-turn-helix transcriptional regulator [Paenibacillus sp. CN-4]|uniref:helix-turn-helix transcriptional regulator n=1 Tax=Paenibacillus nanchangensis TaxID=3348343 RepID=UPI00397C3396